MRTATDNNPPPAQINSWVIQINYEVWALLKLYGDHSTRVQTEHILRALCDGHWADDGPEDPYF